MTKPDVMVLTQLRPDAMDALEARYTLHRWDLAQDKPAFLARHGAGCRSVVTNGHTPMTAQMLEHLPDLELVACASAGFEGFDLVAMADQGVALSNTSSALCDDVADCAIMLLLAARRSLVAADAYVRSGDWGTKGPFPLQSSLKGKVLGIIGMGAIGQAIGARGQAMGQDVRYWNRSEKDVPHTFVPDLIDLARQSDALVVVVPGGAGTEHLIDAPVMEALGRDGLLINVARGTVVDEAAMIEALATGRLGHAALDVYENEPRPDPALTGLPNVTLFPHHASGTVETRDAMAWMVVENLDAFYGGRDLVSPVDLSRNLSQSSGSGSTGSASTGQNRA